MKKVIILNGPPSSGKDTYGKILCNLYDAQHCQFKDALFDATEEYFDLRQGFIDNFYNVKDTHVWNQLGKRTIREALIHVSEEIIKPRYGKDYFGKKAAEKLQERINVFTDGGFPEEIQPIINEVNKENIIIVRVHREGFDFSKDSRDYLSMEGVPTIDVGKFDDDKAYVMKEILFNLHDIKC